MPNDYNFSTGTTQKKDGDNTIYVGNRKNMSDMYKWIKSNPACTEHINWGTEDQFMRGMANPEWRKRAFEDLKKVGAVREDASEDVWDDFLGFKVVNLPKDTETGTGPVKDERSQYMPPFDVDKRYFNAPERSAQAPAQSSVQTPAPEQKKTSDADIYRNVERFNPYFGQQKEEENPYVTPPLTPEATQEMGNRVRESLQKEPTVEERIERFRKSITSDEPTDEEREKRFLASIMPKNLTMGEKAERMEQSIAMTKEIANENLDRLNEEAKEGHAFSHDKWRENELRRQEAEMLREYAEKRQKAAIDFIWNNYIDYAPTYTSTKSHTGGVKMMRMDKALDDNAVGYYAKQMYGVNMEELDSDQKYMLRGELEGILSERILNEALPANDWEYFYHKFFNGFISGQTYDVLVNNFGSDYMKYERLVDKERLERYDQNGDKLTTLVGGAAAGTAMFLNLWMMQGMMEGGFLTKGLGQVAQGGLKTSARFMAPGQARSVSMLLRDGLIANPYTNVSIRTMAALGKGYISWSKLGAVNKSVEIFSDPNMYNRYGSLTGWGWLREVGCEVANAMHEEGMTGVKFHGVLGATGGMAGLAGEYAKSRALAKGEDLVKAAVKGAKTERIARWSSLPVETGFFTIQNINAWNEQHPDDPIGITDYDKWGAIALEQVGMIGAMKAMGVGQSTIHQLRYGKTNYLEGLAYNARHLLENQGLALDKEDFDNLAHAGYGRFSYLNGEMVQALVMKDGKINMKQVLKLLKDRTIPLVTRNKLMLAIGNERTNIGYTTDINGNIVGAFDPLVFVHSSSVYLSPDRKGYEVYLYGLDDELISRHHFSDEQKAKEFAEQTKGLIAQNRARAVETNLGISTSTVKDAIYAFADRYGMDRMDAIELYNDWLNNRKNASPQAKQMAEEVKRMMWRDVSNTRAIVMDRLRQEVKEKTGIDITKALSKPYNELTAEEQEALGQYYNALLEAHRLATTDPEIKWVEDHMDQETNTIRFGVTADGQRVTVRGKGDMLAVTDDQGKTRLISSKQVQITGEIPVEEYMDKLHEERGIAPRFSGQEEHTPNGEEMSGDDMVRAFAIEHDIPLVKASQLYNEWVKDGDKASAEAQQWGPFMEKLKSRTETEASPKEDGKETAPQEQPVESEKAPEQQTTEAKPQEAPAQEAPAAQEEQKPAETETPKTETPKAAPRRVRVYDENGDEVEGEVLGRGRELGSIRVRVDGDGRVIEVPVQDFIEDITTTPEATPETKAEAAPEQPVAQPQETPATASEPMPMVEVNGKMKPDWQHATPKRAHQYIYKESELNRDEANTFVSIKAKEAQDELDRIKARAPKMGSDIDEYKAQRAAWQQQLDAAQAKVDFWQGVKDEQAQVAKAEHEADLAKNKAAQQKAMEEEQKRKEEENQKLQEQGVYTPSKEIVEKWEKAPKEVGYESEIVLADGTHVKGHYVLTESDAVTPSHNPFDNFKPSEGFPVDKNGNSSNTRDYYRDKFAQGVTIQMGKTFDGRAIQEMPVVESGVTLSGNGRTQAGQLAAANGTDGAYIEHLNKTCRQYGFTPEQVASFKHPRIQFVVDENIPFTPEMFDKFNAQTTKAQSGTESAVKLGKTVPESPYRRIVTSISRFDSLGDFYTNPEAAREALQELLDAGVINQMQFAALFDKDGITSQGRDLLENVLIGKAFEGNPEVVRQLSEYRSFRTSVANALSELAANRVITGGYDLADELAEAINLAYQARKAGSKVGDLVSPYARQQNIFAFEEGETVSDYRNATVMMLADLVNDRRATQLKKVLALYNKEAQESAAGQMDLFSGEVRSKENIIKDVLKLLNNGTQREQQQALNEAREQRKRNAEENRLQQDGNDGQGNGESQEKPEPLTSENGEQTTTVDNQIKEEGEKVETNPTEGQKAAGNYKKGHVKIDGYDVTIENPAGSERSGVDENGKPWSVKMNNSYGYIRGTEGKDGDHIDVFLSGNMQGWNGTVYVIDQVKPDGTFDEHKVMYGFNSEKDARDAYLANYSEGWKGLGNITAVSREEFKQWVDSSHRKTKPFAEYKKIQESQGGEPDTPANTMDNMASRALKKHREQQESELRQLMHSLGLSNVENFHIIFGPDELPEEEKTACEAIKAADKNGDVVIEGWYNPKTGQVYINYPHINSIDRARQVILHELVAHKGVKDMLGKPKFDELCSKVYRALSPEERERWEQYILAGILPTGDELHQLAADKYLSNLTEEGLSYRIVNKVRDFLVTIPAFKDYSYNEVAELIKRNGLKGLLNKGQYSELCQSIYNSMLEAERSRCEKLVIDSIPKPEGEDLYRAAADEYMAHMAEKGVEQGTWDKIISTVREFLRKLPGFEDMEFTDDDIRHMLQKSYDRLRQESEQMSEQGEGENRFSREEKEQNNESTAKSDASELRLPTQKSAPVAKVDAKVTLNPERDKRLNDLYTTIEQKGVLGAHELLHEIVNSFDTSLTKGEVEKASTDKSRYFDLGDGVTLRISNHFGSADTFKRHGEYKDNYGFVIKLSPSKFRGNKDVDYLEYVYYPDKLNDAARQKEIVKGLQNFLSTGQFSNLPAPDKINGGNGEEISPKSTTLNDAVRFSIQVNHNSPYLLKKADGSFVDPETGERLGFDHRFMNTGEGAQAHGWGSYFSVNDLRKYAYTDSPAKYKGVDLNLLRRDVLVPDDMPVHEVNVLRIIDQAFTRGFDLEKGKQRVFDIYEKAYKRVSTRADWTDNDYQQYFGLMSKKEIKDQRKEDQEKAKNYKASMDFAASLKKEDFEFPERNHYDVEIPDNDGNNYIEEWGPLTDVQIKMIAEQAAKEGKDDYSMAYRDDDGNLILNMSTDTGHWLYSNELKRVLGSEKEASKFLRRAGIVGIHYDGRTDGECYVIFDENDAKITDHVRFSRRKEEVHSDKFKNWFGDWEKDPKNASKVVDEDGQPMVMYHGDREKGKTVFGRDTFFTSSREYASRYTGGTGEVGEYYLNIRHPFDIRDKKAADIFLKYRNGHPFAKTESGAMDWGDYDYEDLQNYLEENYPGQYDGIIMDEGGDGGYGYEVKRRGLSYVPFRSNQIKSATDNNGEFSPFNDDIRFSRSNKRDEIFVSNAARAVEGIKQEKATPEQWLKMLENGGGLKAAEDKWIGLSDWLKSQDKKSLTKQEVMDYIRENAIQIEEVKYGMSDDQEDFADYRAEYKRYFDEAKAAGEADPQGTAWDKMLEEHGEDFDLGFYAYGDELRWDNKSDYVNYEREQKGLSKPIENTRLKYTTEGLENKSEIALVVPTIEPWNESDEIHFGDAGEGRAVAWVRFGETTDKDGNRVLVIDEIQSKRHQEGREKGYISDSEKKRVALREFRQQLLEKYNTRRLRDVERLATADELQKLEELDKAIIGVPDAPFEKNWHELAMKRMLRFAAENGYDKVAWTTGEQQAERYDIGNVVKNIIHYDNADGKQIIVHLKDGDKMHLTVDADGKIVQGDNVAAGTPLADVMGKSLAMQIMNSEGKDATVWTGEEDVTAKKIDSDGLRIGGEGMKGFYDKMLPSFMQKYGKKWGATVGEVELPNVEEAGRKMWAVDVTPEMKESVMEGQVMFSRRKIREAQERLIEEYKDKELSPSQKEVTSVFSGQVKNKTITFQRGNEKVTIAFRKGDQEHAGIDHSINKHLVGNVGKITSDDILLIPEIIETGVISDGKRQNTRTFEMRLPGTKKLTILTEKKNGQELFENFYSNKTIPSSALDAQDSATRDNGERDSDDGTINAAKVAKNSETANNPVGKQQDMQDNSGESNTHVSFSRRSLSDEAYASRERDKRDYEGRAEKMLRYHEYKQLKDDIRWDRDLMTNTDRRAELTAMVEAKWKEISQGINVDPQTMEERRDKLMRQQTLDDIDREANDLLVSVEDVKKAGGNIGALLKKVREFIRNRMNQKTGQGMGALGINDLLKQLASVTTTDDIDTILMNIRETINNAELKTTREELEKVLATRTQGQTPKGLAKGVMVDATAHQIMEDIKGSYKHLVLSGLEDKRRDLSAQIKKIANDLGYKTATDAIDAADATFIQKTAELRKEKEAIQKEIENVNKQKTVESIEALQTRWQEILEEINTLRDQGKEIPESLIEERIALPVRQRLAEFNKLMQDVSELNRQWKNSDSEHAEQLRREMLDLQRKAVLCGRELTEEIHDILGEGRERRAEQVRKQMEEESKLVRIAIQAVQKNPIKQRNDLPGAAEHADGHPWTTKEKMIASLQESTEWMKKKWRSFTQAYNAPIWSFNFLCKYIDKNHAMGNGPLYDVLMKSNEGAVMSYDRYTDGLVEYGNTIDGKCQELFGKSLAEIMDESRERTLKTITIDMIDPAGHTRTPRKIELTKGQALYVWLAYRQKDGREKLEAEGWTPEVMKEVKELLPEPWLKFGEWVTDEFLPDLRASKYNPTYVKMYGTNMHMTNHYFPLKIWEKTIREKGELGETRPEDEMPSAATGNLIMRKKNTLPLNTEINALEELLNYGRRMERWNALSPLTQKLNTLLHSNTFRNLMVANHGEDFWKKIWIPACELVTDNYSAGGPNFGETIIGQIHNSFLKGAIGYRQHTALKQYLSYPLFLTYSMDGKFMADLTKNFGHQLECYDWAMENLPAFRARVAKGDMGIEGLADKGILGKVGEKYDKYGMYSNKWVDAHTVAAGAKTVYDYEYKQQIKAGKSEEEAKRQATVMAEITFNESQQSSHNAFSSPTQKSNSVIVRSLVSFQNSNISYRRLTQEGWLDFKQANSNQKELEERRKAAQSLGKDTSTFDEAIKECKEARKAGIRKMVVSVVGGSDFWYLGSSLGLIVKVLFSNNDKDKKEAAEELAYGLLFNTLMGMFTNGSMASIPVQTAYSVGYSALHDGKDPNKGDFNPIQSVSLVGEIMADVFRGLMDWAADKKSLSDLALDLSMDYMPRLSGVNPETWTNVMLGVADAIRRGRPELQDAMMIINLPNSQRKAIVETYAKRDDPAEYMRQMEEASRIYEPGDWRTTSLMKGTREMTDKKRNELLDAYIEARDPKFAEFNDQLKEIGKAITEKKREIRDYLEKQGQNRTNDFVTAAARDEVLEKGGFAIDANTYKRLMDSPVGTRKDSKGKEKKVTLMKLYEEKLNECRESAARAEQDPETLNRQVKELLEIQARILGSRK